MSHHKHELDLKSSLNEARPVYFVPRDDIVSDVLVPAFSVSDSVDCMMGFFSSHSLAEIAPGLATFLEKSTNPLRLIISPYLNSDDQKALKDGLLTPDQIATENIVTQLPNADALSKHTLACLAWLIKEERLQLRIAVMRESLFHSKVWIFKDSGNRVAFHGSPNMTASGLRRNREQITLSRSWKGKELEEHVRLFEQEFDDLWSGGDDDCFVLELSEAVKREVLRHYTGGVQPSEDDCKRAWRKAHGFEEELPEIITPIEKIFAIPSYLEYETGEYSHQGKAVDAWRLAKWKGVLEMATGSGKTITAMIGTYWLQKELKKLLVVVSAPYRPLVAQWCEEIEQFGVQPINLTLLGGYINRDKVIKQAGRKLKRGISNIEILVVSNTTLCTEEFIESISSLSLPTLLIADECHNLGASGFVNEPPECFNFRLGLSATPIRQYDEEGTNALFSYFGEVCFQFTLEEAIGKCLAPYDYHVHLVHLDQNEMDDWSELSDKISQVAWKISSGEPDPYLSDLLRKRRLILETADEKLVVLKQLFSRKRSGDIFFTLIYATDKDPRQLEKVNSMLREKGVMFHQLTYEETTDRRKTQNILQSFQDGELRVLTAKRVLDEGVNIPQIMCAYVLASTTVRRQWVQRRGRLLRMCREIDKTHAEIHDFVTVPPKQTDNLDRDAKNIVQGELDRVWEFARLCRNGATKDGPYQAVAYLQGLLSGE